MVMPRSSICATPRLSTSAWPWRSVIPQARPRLQPADRDAQLGAGQDGVGLMMRLYCWSYGQWSMDLRKRVVMFRGLSPARTT